MTVNRRFVVQRTDVAIPHYWGGGGSWVLRVEDAIRFYDRYTAATSFTLDRLMQDNGVKAVVVPYEGDGDEQG